MSLIELLLKPFQYQFFNYGLIAATIAGMLCGLVGVSVVLRRMSYIGHGLSHSIFGGAVVSYALTLSLLGSAVVDETLKLNFYLGAGLWGLLTALLINFTARRRKIGADAAIGIVTTASFAIGVALISKMRNFRINLDAALFGNILGVKDIDLLVLGGVLLFSALVMFFGYKQILFTTFDPEVAPTYGVPTGWIDALFALVLAATLIATMQVMGVTLIAATIVIPAISARMLTDSFAKMLILSTLIGGFCGLLGMIVSYYLNIASGASIVLFSAAFFLAVLGWNGLRARLQPDQAPGFQRLAATGTAELFE